MAKTIGPGQTDDNTYYGNSSYSGLSPAATYVLTYALPLRKLVITGRDADPAGWLDETEAAAAVAAGRFDLDRREMTPEQLVEAFGNWSPIVRSWAAEELETAGKQKPSCRRCGARRWHRPAPHPGSVRDSRPVDTGEALPVLVKHLAHPDRWVRYKAAEAVKKMGGTARPAIEDILKAFVATAEPSWPIRWDDPVQVAHGELANAVFRGPLRDELNKVDPTLRNQAIRAVSTNPDGMARATLEHCFQNQLSEDVVRPRSCHPCRRRKPQPGGHDVNNVIRMAGLRRGPNIILKKASRQRSAWRKPRAATVAKAARARS